MSEPFQLTIPKYDGPFDLILDAIKDGKINIFEISLLEVTSAYFDYLKKMSEIDLNAASEFLITAAYLLELKSKKLLPQPEEIAEIEEEEELEADLADHIREYQVFKDIAGQLKQKKDSFSRVYSRFHSNEAEAEPKDFFLTDVSLSDLVLAFQRVYKTFSEEENITGIKNDELTLPQRIDEVVDILKESRGMVAFEKLFFRRTRMEAVITFLAILELCRKREIKIMQEGRFNGIFIRLSKA